MANSPLDKYSELGNTAKALLIKFLENPDSVMKWSELKIIAGSDKVLKDGIDQLLSFRIIKKLHKGSYQLTQKYQWQLILIARKQSDKINLDSYPFDEIINLSSTKSKTTIYGLKSQIFNKVEENKRNLDFNQIETLKFEQGISATELLGKKFGLPLSVEFKLEKDATEKELIKAEVDYYLDLINQGAKIDNILAAVISRHRAIKIDFKDVGDNLTQKLIELKKEHRYNSLEKSYSNLLRKEPRSRSKNILKNFKTEFLLILNYCDISIDWLKETIFKFYGIGRGLYSTSGISEDKEKWARNGQVATAIDKLDKKDRNRVIKFLTEVINQNFNLYPTHVSFLSRAHSTDLYPELSSKPHRKSTAIGPKKKTL